MGMFAVVPLALSMLIATPQQQSGEDAPSQPSALSEWLESRSNDWQSNVSLQQSAKFGLQADMFMAVTEKADAFDQFNRFRLRSLVFNAQQNLDFGVVFGTFAIGDYDDFDEVVVSQLGIMLTDIGLGLPGTADLQIGSARKAKPIDVCEHNPEL